MDSFEKLILDKAIWLARRLNQYYEANIELATENEKLRVSNEALISENRRLEASLTEQVRLAIENRPRAKRGSR